MQKDTKKIAENIAREYVAVPVDFAEAAKFLNLVAKSIEDGDISLNAQSDFEYVLEVLDETGVEKNILHFVMGLYKEFTAYRSRQMRLEDEQKEIKRDVIQFAKKLRSVAKRW